MLEALLAIALIGWLATYLRLKSRIRFLEMFVDMQMMQINQSIVLLDLVFGKPKKYENNVIPFGRK